MKETTKKRRLSDKVFRSMALQSIVLLLSSTGLALLFAYIVEDSIFDRLLQHHSETLQSHQNILARKATKSEVQATTGIKQNPWENKNYFIQRYDSLDELPQEVAELVKLNSRQREFSTSQGHFHLWPVVSESGQRQYLLARVDELMVVRSGRSSIIIAFVVVQLLILIVALVLSRRLSSQILQPLSKLTDSLTLNSGFGGGVRVAEVESGETHDSDKGDNKDGDSKLQDEVTLISQQLRNNFLQIQSSLQREKDFSRDVGHELRTPISILRNTIVLDLQGHKSEPNLNAVYQKMQLTIDTLMSIAKGETLQNGPMNLTEVIEQSILEFSVGLSNRDINFDVDIPQQWPVIANVEAVIMLLHNLYANSVEHGSDARLSIYQDDDKLILENAIDAEFAAALQRNPDIVSDRGERSNGSTGIGQGLYLVRRICDQLDWGFAVRSRILKNGESDVEQAVIQLIVSPLVDGKAWDVDWQLKLNYR